jgi:hypothetical protein
MAEYSSEDASYAARIVNRLMSPEEAEGFDLEQDLVVSDVEGDAEAFSDDLAFLSEFDANVPAVAIGGEAVPVSLDLAFGDRGLFLPFRFGKGRRRWRGHPFFHEMAYDLLRSFTKERRFDGYESLGRDEARATFVRRATDFVATRIAAVRTFRNGDPHTAWHQRSLLTLPERLRGRQATTPGCQFTVSSNSNGLRVFWSGAYRLSPNNFNHPTTPTSSVLQSGTYVFGVDGGAYGNTIAWDLNLVVTLPGLPHAHLNY